MNMGVGGQNVVDANTVFAVDKTDAALHGESQVFFAAGTLQGVRQIFFVTVCYICKYRITRRALHPKESAPR